MMRCRIEIITYTRLIVLNTCYENKDGKDYPYFERNFKETGVTFPRIPKEELEWL